MDFSKIDKNFLINKKVDTETVVFRSCTDRKQGSKKFMNIQIYYVLGVMIAVLCSIIINPAYSLDATRCIGACGLAPVLTVNDEVYGRLKKEDIDGILEKYMD